MFGTIQLSDVLFGSHVSSMSKAKESLAGVGKPTFNTTGESKALDLYQEQFNELHQLGEVLHGSTGSGSRFDDGYRERDVPN